MTSDASLSQDSAPSSPEQYGPKTNAFSVLKDKIYFHRFPSYGNKIFYSLGFLALTCLTLLVITGTVMAFMGPTWWLASGWGVFFRSVHLWAVQAFIAILILHILVVFTTSAFKPPRRMAWVFGSTIFCLALIQTEFGYALRGDFSSQYRIISGADFWNGSYLGHILNPLNFAQDFALHTVIIPLLILGLFCCHYLLVHSYGIAKPYRSDIAYKMVPADHVKMYLRGIVLIACIVTMALLFPSPFVEPVRMSDLAQQDPALFAQTLMGEFARTSGTATYLDSIDPYTYDTRQVYVVAPYEMYNDAAGGQNAWSAFSNEPPAAQQADIEEAARYFSSAGGPAISVSPLQRGVGREQKDALTLSGPFQTYVSPSASTTNPVILMVNTLLAMAQSGLYESTLDQENPASNYTYSLNFLRDTGLLDAEAAAVHITTEEWGMVREETGSLKRPPPGAWWFAPIGILNSTVLRNDNDGDRDGSFILFGAMLLFVLFPYIPYLNRLPEKLRLAPFIWKQ